MNNLEQYYISIKNIHWCSVFSSWVLLLPRKGFTLRPTLIEPLEIPRSSTIQTPNGCFQSFLTLIKTKIECNFKVFHLSDIFQSYLHQSRWIRTLSSDIQHT